MSTDVILACGGIGREANEEPSLELKMLKALRIIFVLMNTSGGERVFALKTRKFDDPKKKKADRAVEAALKKCEILGRDAGWIFFLADTKSVMELLAVKGVNLESLTEMELIGWLKKKRG